MKMVKRVAAAVMCAVLWFPLAGAAADSKPLEEGQPIQLTAPSAILAEVSTGTVIFEKDADAKREAASITKMMTALIVFEALEANQVSLTDQVTVSKNAAAMKGSQALLDADAAYSLEDLRVAFDRIEAFIQALRAEKNGAGAEK